MSKIKNQVVLVTGANRGIGLAFVEALVAAGASKIYATARKAETLDKLVQAHGDKIVPVTLDVTDADAIKAVAADLQDVSVLINNAGVAHMGGFISASDLDAARKEMETNYFGPLNLIRAFAPTLKKNGGGAIVNIASIASFITFPALGSYSASKAAAHSLTQGVRAELAAQNTLVMGVYPGPIETDMSAGLEMDKTSPNVVAQTVLQAVDNGEEDVYPDPTSAHMHAGLLADPKAVEKETAKMLPN